MMEFRPWNGDRVGRRGCGAGGGDLESLLGGVGAALETEAAGIRGGGSGVCGNEAGALVAGTEQPNISPVSAEVGRLLI